MWYNEDEEEEDLLFSPALMARRASESWINTPPIEVMVIAVALVFAAETSCQADFVFRASDTQGCCSVSASGAKLLQIELHLKTLYRLASVLVLC
jgi:hypothetical protein